MPLVIHHGPQLVPLAEGLADVLAGPTADAFTPDVVAVPTAGVRDFLQRELGRRLGAASGGDGIVANVQMVFPGRFIATALGRPLDASSPWDLERLTWSVLAAIESGEVEVPGWRRDRRSGSAARHGTFATARRLADVFDRAANNRPQILQQWAAGHDGDGTLDENGAVVPLAPEQLWQPRLWRHVRERIGVPTEAERVTELLSALRAGALHVELPERVAVFGISGLSAAQLEVVSALGAHRDVHLFVPHPSPAAWRSGKHELRGRLVARAAVDATAGVHHPLLRSWGRPAMEAAALIRGTDAEVRSVASAAAARTPASRLGRLQDDIIADRAPQPVPAVPNDRSVQVHACHGTVRQLEVLRDALGHLFAADATLLAHDVVVLCPDLARFAPLARSVFARSTLPIPVRVTDLTLGSSNPVAAALLAVLDVIGGRCTGPEVLGICSLDPVRRAFAFDDDAIERIDRWMNDVGVTWGLDGEHRSRWIDGDISEGSWASALDRIFLGAAMPAPVPRVGPDEIVPFDDVDANGLVIAGRLAELVHRLRRFRGRTVEALPVEDWIAVLTEMVESLFATLPADSWQLVQLMETLSGIGRSAEGAAVTSAVRLTLSDVRSLLAGATTAQHGRLDLRSGSVTMTAMVPVRNVPARVLCILGLEEGTLRAGGGDGDDLLAARPCVGERDPRAEGRQLLLDAVMAASEHLLITCDGNDITTNRRLDLPIVVHELLAAIGTHEDDPDVVRRHPRQAFDEQNFLGGDGTDPFLPCSFDRTMLQAAEVRRHAVPTQATALAQLAPVQPTSVTIGELADSLARPARTYLLHRLDARLPREVEEIDTDIPLGLGGLDSWQLGRELLDHHHRGGDAAQLDGWREAKRHSGTLPPRRLADASIDEVAQGVDAMLDAVDGLRERVRASNRADIDVLVDPLEADLMPARLTGLVERISDDDVLIRIEYSRPKNRHVLTAVLELAALVVADPTRSWRAQVVSRPKSSSSSKPTVVELQPIASPDRVDAARRVLQMALSLHLRALREPVPLFDTCSKALYTTRNFEDEDLDADLRDPHMAMMWAEATADEILAIPVAATDPVEVADIAAVVPITGGGKAHAYAVWMWDTILGFVEADAEDE